MHHPSDLPDMKQAGSKAALRAAEQDNSEGAQEGTKEKRKNLEGQGGLHQGAAAEWEEGERKRWTPC